VDNVTEIIKLAEIRLKEAKVLFDNQLYDGCIYLAGYSVELMLKAKIAQLLDVDDLFVTFDSRVLRPFKVHNLEDLLLYSGLYKEVAESEDETFYGYWSLLVSRWSEHLRYEKCGTCDMVNASELLTAIEDNQNGILQWIKEKF